MIGFRSDGSLDYLQDTNGNRITAGYTGNQLTSLTHSNGKALTLSYNAQGRISQVTDPAGRVATYVYDASGEHLLRVTTSPARPNTLIRRKPADRVPTPWLRSASRRGHTSSSTTTVRAGWRGKNAMAAPNR